MTVVIYYTVTSRSGLRRQAAGRFRDIKAFTEYVNENRHICGWQRVDVDRLDQLQPELE